jgi:putative hydrolase of the HAD superfamily
MRASKPGEEIYRKMLLEGNMKAEETLFIDDSEKNIEAARRLGICTLKVENGEDWRPMLDRILLADR